MANSAASGTGLQDVLHHQWPDLGPFGSRGSTEGAADGLYESSRQCETLYPGLMRSLPWVDMV